MTARVLMTVWCGDCGSKIDDFMDSIEDKYPFYCPTCEDRPAGKYPWRLEAAVIDEPGRWQETTSGRVFIKELS